MLNVNIVTFWLNKEKNENSTRLKVQDDIEIVL